MVQVEVEVGAVYRVTVVGKTWHCGWTHCWQSGGCLQVPSWHAPARLWKDNKDDSAKGAWSSSVVWYTGEHWCCVGQDLLQQQDMAEEAQGRLTRPYSQLVSGLQGIKKKPSRVDCWLVWSWEYFLYSWHDNLLDNQPTGSILSSSFHCHSSTSHHILRTCNILIPPMVSFFPCWVKVVGMLSSWHEGLKWEKNHGAVQYSLVDVLILIVLALRYTAAMVPHHGYAHPLYIKFMLPFPPPPRLLPHYPMSPLYIPLISDHRPLWTSVTFVVAQVSVCWLIPENDADSWSGWHFSPLGEKLSEPR